MGSLRVSIALATYNGERFLSQQLDSYLRQTRLPDELCISDDGSSDGTLHLAEEFQKKAPFPVRIGRNHQRRGVNGNFESVMLDCCGDIILFSDQDDVWLPNHVEILASLVESDPRIVAAASNSKYVNEELVETGVDAQSSERFPNHMRDAVRRLPANQFELILRHRVAYGHGMAIRSRLRPVLVPFSDTWSWDQWVFILAAAAGLVTYATVPLSLHRQHSRQAAGNRRVNLAKWAENSASRSLSEEQMEVERWRELVAFVRERRDLLPNGDFVLHALDEKLAFVTRRIKARGAGLPARSVFALRELLSGRYHRWGRGMLTFARDLYGRS